VTAETPSVSAEDEVSRHAGWSDVAIHDALQVIAYFNYRKDHQRGRNRRRVGLERPTLSAVRPRL
jgi:hypothetical protein